MQYDIRIRESKLSNTIPNSIPTNFFSVFNDVECHTLYLLYLGYNIGEISVTLGISRVAVTKVMSSISNKNVWGNIEWHLSDHLPIKRSLA